MRAHEKMLLNSTFMKAVPYVRNDGLGGGCALGMIDDENARAFTLYPFLARKAELPCQCVGGDIYSDYRTMLKGEHVIAHLFNEHVMQGGKCPSAEPWTMERLADHIKSIDTTVDQDEEPICEQAMETVSA